MHVLIIGGLGYIGGRIASYLNNLPDCRVTITSHRQDPKFPNILSEIPIKYLDVSQSPKAIANQLKDVDSIIHLAAISEQYCDRDLEKAYAVNTVGVENVFHAAKLAQVKKFIYFSTVHVYGLDLIGEISESTKPNPMSTYAITHYAAEQHLKNGADKEIDVIILRLSNAFGAPINPQVDRWTLLLNMLAKEISEKGTCTLKSSGLQTRDFITLTDVCLSIEKIILSKNSIENFNIINFCSGKSMSIKEMAEKLAVRASVEMSKKITLSLPKGIKDEQVNSHFFSNDKLKNMGIDIQNEIDDELDSLLRFCMSSFMNQDIYAA